MVSLLRLTASTCSWTIRLTTFVFLRWIPGHHFPPLIFTSLALYLSSLLALSRKGKERDEPPKGSAVRALWSGLPSANRLATAMTVLINIVLSLLVLDFLIRGLVLYPGTSLAFSRVGYVSPTTANLLVREPDAAQLPLGIYYQEAAQTSEWIQEGTIYTVDNTTDFTVPVTLHNLKPSTAYRYSLSNNKTGSFTTAPHPGSKADTKLSFLTSSCLKPNFPYNPFSHPLRIIGIEQLSDFIGQLTLRPAFMLFLGDFIYIDVPHRFGSSVAHYRSEYRRVYSSPSWSYGDPATSIPWLHTLDDHEIANDWSKGNTTAPYPAAVDPYVHYHVSVNPPVPPLASRENTTYFSFTNGPASFFMLDTRTYRSKPSRANSTMLGSAQLHSLLAFLGRPEPANVRWKMVASSVPFTKNWRVGTSDTWGGFLRERRTVFEAMWRAERDLGVRIVLLSGDRHEFGAIHFPDPNIDSMANDSTPNSAGEGLHEFCVGPLNMFYLPIRSFRQTDAEDVTVKYIPDGNTKFGLVDIESENEIVDTVTKSGRPSTISVPSSVLTYSLFVDGEVVWKYKLGVPLLEVGGAQATAVAGAKHARLPPGKVLLDKRVHEGWGVVLKGAIGRAEELGRVVRCWGYDRYIEVLEKTARLNGLIRVKS